MPGRSRIPRCPVCGTVLPTHRTIDERWVRRHPEPDVWVYRLACAQCLCVARVEIPEVSALVRSEPSRPVVDVAGGVTARLLERLAAAREAEALAAVVATVVGHEEQRFLLRVPEVLSRARALYEGTVRLRHGVVADWPGGTDGSRPAGRLLLHAAPPRDPEATAAGWELRLPAGQCLGVRGIDGGALLLEPPRDGSETAEWLSGVEALLAWPDFVEPLPESG